MIMFYSNTKNVSTLGRSKTAVVPTVYFELYIACIRHKYYNKLEFKRFDMCPCEEKAKQTTNEC